MLDRIIDILRRGRRFLITAHVGPDGDSIGSQLGLYHLLTQEGKEMVIYNQDSVPGNYRFLTGSEVITQVLDGLDSFDAAIMLDCSELERIGDEAARIGGMVPLINIDHHLSTRDFGAVSYIDMHASSTAELVCRLVARMGLRIPKAAADNLYAGILTDTGGFCYGNTGAETLRFAGELVQNGADPQWLSENIYESKPEAKIRLLAKTLETLCFDLGNRVGSLVVTQEALRSCKALMEHTEGFVDLPRTVQGVEVSLLFSEIGDRSFKLSLRSKGRTNVEQIARAFGGGGHMNASACRISGDFETVKRRVLAVIEPTLSP